MAEEAPKENGALLGSDEAVVVEEPKVKGVLAGCVSAGLVAGAPNVNGLDFGSSTFGVSAVEGVDEPPKLKLVAALLVSEEAGALEEKEKPVDDAAAGAETLEEADGFPNCVSAVASMYRCKLTEKGAGTVV